MVVTCAQLSFIIVRRPEHRRSSSGSLRIVAPAVLRDRGRYYSCSVGQVEFIGRAR
jgi:hypothetical protein